MPKNIFSQSPIKQYDLPKDPSFDIVSEYMTIANIGSGEYSSVYHVKHIHTHCDVALKKVNILKDTNHAFDTEVCLLQKMEHPNIISMIGYDQIHGFGFLLLEYFPVNLGQYVVRCGPFSDAEGLLVFRSIVAGLSYIHSMNISHHDFKPENVVYNPDTGDTKLIDFGMSVEFEPDKKLLYYSGSPLYMSPELLVNGRSAAHDPVKSDVWSCGVVFWYMLVGDLPWNVQTMNELIIAVMSKLCWPNDISPISKGILKRMLEKDANLRITSQRLNSLTQQLCNV
eukprot:TRINITY_DN10854_c0_g1_i1.p1 TRINITY_DN10854_c0_g1~~TRINITY_DN10854_c0_g1_i1.p1  ORF type:complete len:283 (-),score=46.52 TRINITY_DN10854_c0_g1_i1:24-872(-)